MQVTKRNGSQEEYNVEKIHKVVNWAIDGINEVSLSDIELGTNLGLYDGISTREIHQVLIKSTNELISEERPNYQYVASRLLGYSLRKDVWGSSEPPRVYDHIKKLVDLDIYDPNILEYYSESEIHKIGQFIKHERDNLFTSAGLQQMVDKYLIKNRETGEIYETPQFVFLLIPMICFAKYDKSIRSKYIKKAYDYLSTFKISLPTPILSGVRTKLRQFSSCILIDVGDSLKSIFASLTAVGYYSAKRAGIGLNFGRIRPLNSMIRGGEVRHTGILPYIKIFESTVKSTTQNGIRGANGTCSVMFFHPEVEDIIVLKNSSGTDDNRIRKLDYSIQLSKLFYKRVIEDKEITLFSPHECPELYENFGLDKFDEIYEKLEKKKDLKFKRKINARGLLQLLIKERMQTGRIYITNIDSCNEHSSFLDRVTMGNLCKEVLHPTTPIEDINDENGEIGVCVLAAINTLETKKEEFEDVADILVRMEDEIIDYQDYPVKAAEKFCKSRRSIGVGFTNIAALLAKNKVEYGSKECLELLDEYSELLQFSLLNASCNLSKEKGQCEKYDRTKYSKGIFPYHTYKKSVDKLVNHKTRCDWSGLEKRIKEYGLRNSTVTAQMPCESSSVYQNSTNGIDPIRDLISYKKSKSGLLKQVVPNIHKYGKYYTKAFDIKSNTLTTNVTAIIQKWMDMGISYNQYYNYDHYEGKSVPFDLLIKDILYAYNMGVKTLYYANTNDGDKEESCVSGACSI